MTVYIDDMYLYPIGRFGRMKMSHMIADTEAELHAMADKIGLARRWYRDDHYDVSMTRRSSALENGAVAVTLEQLAAMAYFQRRGLEMPEPDEAVSLMIAEMNRRAKARERRGVV